MRKYIFASAVVVSIAAALALAGCGGSSSRPAPAAKPSVADAEFIQTHVAEKFGIEVGSTTYEEVVAKLDGPESISEDGTSAVFKVASDDLTCEVAFRFENGKVKSIGEVKIPLPPEICAPPVPSGGSG